MRGAAAPAPLLRPYSNWGSRYTRRDALQESSQADPGSSHSDRAGGGGGGTEDADLRSRGLWHGWNQICLSWVSSYHSIPFPSTKRTYSSCQGKGCSQQTESARVRLSLHELGVADHATGDNWPNRGSSTQDPLLWAFQLWYNLPQSCLSLAAPPQQEATEVAFVESCDVVLLLPWLAAFTRRGGRMQRDDAPERTEGATFERALRTCLHTGRGEIRKRAPFWRSRAQQKMKGGVGRAACWLCGRAAAVLASTRLWRLDGECACQELFGITSSSSTLSGPGKI